MGLAELFFTGVGLSMDAFAASICKGLKMKKYNLCQTLVIGLFFGGFQALMPLLGWMLGRQFASYITSFDHWIAFVLLGIIGINMIRESLSKDEKEDTNEELRLDIKELFLLAIATSIDAFTVGITFAFLNVAIFSAISIIGCTTFLISIFGVFVGNYFGNRYEKKAEFAGGVILIIIGIKVLLEHLFL